MLYALWMCYSERVCWMRSDKCRRCWFCWEKSWASCLQEWISTPPGNSLLCAYPILFLLVSKSVWCATISTCCFLSICNAVSSHYHLLVSVYQIIQLGCTEECERVALQLKVELKIDVCSEILAYLYYDTIESYLQYSRWLMLLC